MISIPARWIAFTLFLLSGATGLVYEVVWTRQLVFLLGGTTYAITTVLVAFMSGLALGSWLSGRWGERLSRPGFAYGVIEIAVGVYALLVPVLLRVADPLYRAMYPHVADSPWILTAARFCVGALVLLAPATCMGATLPMLVRYVTRGSGGLGRSAGLLYGINTCGAVVGTLLAGFVLIPRLGLRSTTWATACVNVAIGVIALLALRDRAAAPEPASPGPAPGVPTLKAKKLRRAEAAAATGVTKDVRQTILAVAGFSGFAAMVYQIAWTRALIMSLGSSTYAFTCILAAFILGLGVGSLAVARWVDRWSRPVLLLALMELGIGLAAVCILPVYGQLPEYIRHLVEQKHQDYGGLLVAEFMILIAITFVPTFLMGAIFPLVVRLVGTESEAGSAVGLAYAINTVGTIVGSFLAGFVLIRGDVLGIQNSIVAAAALNAVAAVWLLTKSGPAGKLVPIHAIAGCAGLAGVLLIGTASGEWQRERLTSAPFIYRGDNTINQREVLYFFEDVDTTVSVERVGGEAGSLTLSVNGKADASTGPSDVRTQLLVGHLPALLDRNGRKACIIGLGSGMTVGSVAQYPSYQQIDCVELSEAVIEASDYFKEQTYDILRNEPRLRLFRADGRNHLLLTSEQYDLIVSEPSNPWLAGISNLFTREFFDLCRSRLTPEGVFAVWLQSYSTSEASFRMVIRTLFETFDSVSIWEAGLNDYCLIAWNGPATVGLEEVAARFEAPSVRQDLYRIALFDLGAVLGNYVIGGQRLRAWVEGAPIHTDDNALLEFRSPWDLYSRPYVAITNALVSLQQSPLDHLVRLPSPPGDASRALDIEAVKATAEARLRSRAQRARAIRMWEEESPEDGVRTLIEAYRADPGNFLTCQLLMMYAGELEDVKHRRPESAALLGEMEDLPLPPISPRPGTPLPGMVEELKRLAHEAAVARQWYSATFYVEQARRLAPDDPQLAQMEALARQQRPATTTASQPAGGSGPS